jgi:preprotein translocase subunit YajC
MNSQGLGGLLLPILILVFFYFFLIVPEQKKQKKFKAMVEALKVGDEIITRGGVYGKIANIKDDYMIIESGAERTKLKITKNAVSSVVTSSEEK